MRILMLLVLILSTQGCSLMAASTIAMSRDPINTEENKQSCEDTGGSVAEIEEDYEKTPTRVKHHSNVKCK